MCGILAYISNNNIYNSKVKKIKQLMQSRGPDNQSYQKYLFGKKYIHFFHSRLSIQDLEKRSNQPFIYNDYVITKLEYKSIFILKNIWLLPL